jgi:hypothetical protein
MLVDSAGNQHGAVLGAIRNAARATGTDFQYLLATAQVESGLDPRAAVSSSSAKGLFQFIDQTWLTTMKQAGPALGYGRYADAIVKTASGSYTVPDPAMRHEILGLRDDPTVNAAMAGAFTQENAALLAQKIGRPPSEGELYLAHFLGAGGAGQLINRASETPNTSAASVFPHAARANRSIFYDRQGQARSLSDVYHLLVARYDMARASPANAAVASAAPLDLTSGAVPPAQQAHPAAALAVAAATSAAPQTDPRQPFHSLFSDGSRAPVSQFVRDLWTTNPRVAAALSGVPGPATAAPDAAPAPRSGPLLDLFTDQPSNVRTLFGERA